MYVLAMNLPAKEVAEHHFDTKIIRAINRRPALVNSFLAVSTDVTLRDGVSGEYFETLALQIDYPRLQRALKHVALGLYRYHFDQSWQGSLSVWPEFLRDVDHHDDRGLNALQEQLSQVADMEFADTSLHGQNLPVFAYQTVVPKARADVLMRMHFYEGVKVLALFGERSN